MRRGGSMWGPAQFWCDSDTALKKKGYQLMTTTKTNVSETLEERVVLGNVECSKLRGTG